MKDTFTLLNLSVKRKNQLKKDKAEQFNRRVLGEKGLDKYQKEALRKRNQEIRDEFDQNHLGNYKLVYPVLEDPEKAKLFDRFLEHSKLIWSEFTGGSKPQNQIANKNSQQANQNSQPIKNPKTDPQAVKTKAQFLQNAYSKQSTTFVNGNKQLTSDKLFLKRNQINQNLLQDLTEENTELSKTQTANFKNLPNLTQNNQPPSYYDYINSPQKDQGFESITISQALESPERRKYFQNNPCIISQSPGMLGAQNRAAQNYDFGVPTQSLAEAIQKRFPMVRLETQATNNYLISHVGHLSTKKNVHHLSNYKTDQIQSFNIHQSPQVYNSNTMYSAQNPGGKSIPQILNICDQGDDLSLNNLNNSKSEGDDQSRVGRSQMQTVQSTAQKVRQSLTSHRQSGTDTRGDLSKIKPFIVNAFNQHGLQLDGQNLQGYDLIATQSLTYNPGMPPSTSHSQPPQARVTAFKQLESNEFGVNERHALTGNLTQSGRQFNYLNNTISSQQQKQQQPSRHKESKSVSNSNVNFSQQEKKVKNANIQQNPNKGNQQGGQIKKENNTQQYFYIQNQNTSLIQNMERYNILKHIEAVKRTINNPQLNMMKQKISKKYQTFAASSAGNQFSAMQSNSTASSFPLTVSNHLQHPQNYSQMSKYSQPPPQNLQVLDQQQQQTYNPAFNLTANLMSGFGMNGQNSKPINFVHSLTVSNPVKSAAQNPLVTNNLGKCNSSLSQNAPIIQKNSKQVLNSLAVNQHAAAQASNQPIIRQASHSVKQQHSMAMEWSQVGGSERKSQTRLTALDSTPIRQPNFGQPLSQNIANLLSNQVQSNPKNQQQTIINNSTKY